MNATIGGTASGELNDDSVARLLLDPSSYPEPTTHVERIDTHISSVFITDRFVYKLKKTVRFDFLDFSTVEKRREACKRELTLNRRLARDCYLDVLPITSDAATAMKSGNGMPRDVRRQTAPATKFEKPNAMLKIGGSGTPVDWLVKMRRLPSHRALDQLIRTRKIQAVEIKSLAATLGRFFQQAPPFNISVEAYRRRIAEHVDANDQELFRWAGDARYELAAVKRVHQAQRRVLHLAPDLFDARVCDGRIIDGHGDLRPEHIYFNSHPTIIDCIEFNDEFRQLDILDELSFLAIECERLDAAWIGNDIIRHYQTTSSDGFCETLLHFYKSYRACVRAKVLALRAKQLADGPRDQSLEEVGSYVHLADRHARQIGPPALILTYGLPGTGKSTLASQIADKLAIEVLRTDQIRREMFGERVAKTEFGQGAYQPEMRAAVYREMLRRADRLLGDGVSVILDGTFELAALRQVAIQLAIDRKAVPFLAHCQCPAHTAGERIRVRQERGESLSDATRETHQRIAETFEHDPKDVAICHVDTTESHAGLLRTVFSHLRRIAVVD